MLAALFVVASATESYPEKPAYPAAAYPAAYAKSYDSYEYVSFWTLVDTIIMLWYYGLVLVVSRE